VILTIIVYYKFEGNFAQPVSYKMGLPISTTYDELVVQQQQWPSAVFSNIPARCYLSSVKIHGRFTCEIRYRLWTREEYVA